MDGTESGNAREEPLCSLADLFWVIDPLVRSAAPRSVCEIGVDEGRFAEWLLDYCRTSGCSYTGIDVGITPRVVPLAGGTEAHYVRGRSLEVLPRLPPCDVYFIDGDHNYFTVLNELRLVLPDTGAPLVFLHDVGWPWGRRDMYYSPDGIPPEFRHPSASDRGPVPGMAELTAWGHGGRHGRIRFASAEREGGPRNGVLTAVEDFMRERVPPGGWRFLLVPGIFGLGILVKARTVSPAVSAHLDRLGSALDMLGGLLASVEEDRLRIFAEFLRSFDHGTSLGASYEELMSVYKISQQNYDELAAAYKDLDRHAADLLAAYRELEAHAQRLEATDGQRREGTGPP